MYEMDRVVYHCSAGADGLLKLRDAVAMMMDSCQFQEYAETKFCNWLRSNDILVFLASLQMNILRRPAFREKLKVKVVIYDCQSIYGYRRITIRDEKGDLCMIANGIGCFFNFKTARAVKLPENIEDYLIMDPAEEMDCPPRKIPLPADEGIQLSPCTVMPSMLDPNKHLTSAEYFAIAEDRLPEDFHYSRVRVEFKHQAVPGTVITPVMHRTAPGVIVIAFRSGENTLHALIEFS